MRKATLRAAAASLALACSICCAGQDVGYWQAAGTNSKAITGDISIGGNKVIIDFYGFTLAPIRTLGPTEVAAAFDADVNAGEHGALYRLSVPPGKRFLHHNTLCGTDDTEWMATYVSGRTLQVAFFSGLDAPVFTVDALSNSTRLCGIFSYAR